MGRLGLLVLLCLGPAAVAAQSQPPIRILNPTNPNPVPSDARMMQFDVETKGANWRVFAVNTLPEAPIAMDQRIVGVGIERLQRCIHQIRTQKIFTTEAQSHGEESLSSVQEFPKNRFERERRTA